MSRPGERDGEEGIGLQAEIHLAATEVARGDLVRATMAVRSPAGSSPRRAEWGAPVTGGIRRRGALEPRGWFSGRVLPPGVYEVVVHVLLSLGREQFRLEAVGPEIHLV